MNKYEREKIFLQAKEWILTAGKTIRNQINAPLKIDTKSNSNDLVTQMDKSTEVYFITNIHEAYPEHSVLSEEGYGDHLDSLSGVVWIIDPIDGTMNFVHQKRNFAISIGIYYDGIGEIGLIYDVMADVLYTAKKDEGAMKNGVELPHLKKELKLEESILGMNHLWLCENKLVDASSMQALVKKVRGTRANGSAALEFAYVAEGILDGYLAMNLNPWDIAAGIVIVNEVGGLTTDMAGHSLHLLQSQSVFVSHPKIHSQITTDYYQAKRK